MCKICALFYADRGRQGDECRGMDGRRGMRKGAQPPSEPVLILSFRSRGRTGFYFSSCGLSNYKYASPKGKRTKKNYALL